MVQKRPTKVQKRPSRAILEPLLVQKWPLRATFEPSMVQKRPRKVRSVTAKVRKRPRRTRYLITDFFAGRDEGMRRQQAGQDQRSPQAVTAREAGSVVWRHAHVPAATGQRRLRESLRGPEAAFVAHARPRAHTGRKRAQNRPSWRLRGTSATQAASSRHGGPCQHASSATTAATETRARPRRAAAVDGRRGHMLAPTRPPRLAPDAAPGARGRRAIGTSGRPSEAAPAAVVHADPEVTDAGRHVGHVTHQRASGRALEAARSHVTHGSWGALAAFAAARP